MNYTITNPQGLDIPIYQLQVLLYNSLKTVWDLTDASFNSYPRCYKSKVGDSVIPTMYTGGKGYQDVFGDDKLAAQSFFYVSDRITDENERGCVVDVALIFFTNLDRLKTTLGIAHRGDEEVRQDVYKLCSAGQYGFVIKGIQTGVDAVFKEFSGPMKDKMQAADEAKYHTFRFDFRLRYDPTGCILIPMGTLC
jgi:hypothetical protein